MLKGEKGKVKSKIFSIPLYLGFPVKVKKINSNFRPIFFQKPVLDSKFGIPEVLIWIHSK